MIRLAARWLVVAILVVLGVMAAAWSASASNRSTSDVGTYAYDGHHRAAVPTYTITELGPPLTYDRGNVCSLVEDLANGASARPNAATAPAVFTYDHPAPPGQVASAVPTTEQSEHVTRAMLSSLARSGVAANTGTKLGWSAGDDIYSLTKAGNTPAWSTVRGRFWKNEAANPQIDSWSASNLDRMKRGLAPQRYNRDKGGLESMELSHEPIPYRDGGTNVIPRWPQDHANVDPFRFPGY